MKGAGLAVGVMVLLVVGVGAFFLFTGGASVPEVSAPQPTEDELSTVPSATEKAEGVVVSFTGDGFEPSVVTVKAGQSVTFVNETDGDFWPASAVHPTHQELPGFDALRPFGPGQTYSFTFEELGSWNYHDHLSPRMTGTVTVEN